MKKPNIELEKQLKQIEDSKNRLLSNQSVPLLRIFIEVSAMELKTEAIKAFKKNNY